jgi:U3 small nucleolar ribonucleoprotein protein IMP4
MIRRVFTPFNQILFLIINYQTNFYTFKVIREFKMLYTIESKLIITTSRKPSQITRRFAQFIKHYFGASYINRGKMSFSKVIFKAKEEENTLLLILNETKGNPSSIDVYNVSVDDENPFLNLNFTISLPSSNNRINTDINNIFFINKNNKLDDLFDLFVSVDVDEHIDNNCVVVKSSEDNLADIIFIDRNANDTRYKIFLKGFNINK